MDRNQADALIAELSEKSGIEGLKLDEDGICSITIDNGQTTVTLGHDIVRNTLNLMICLDEIAPSGTQLGELLKANFAWYQTDGAAFAIEPISGALVLQRRCPADELQGGQLLAIVESMVATTERWAGHFALPHPMDDMPVDNKRSFFDMEQRA